MHAPRYLWPVLCGLIAVVLLAWAGTELNAEDNQEQTVVQTENMVVVLEGSFADGRKHDLAGVAASVDLTIGKGTLELAGEISKGTYQNGAIEFDAELEQQSPFEYAKGRVVARLNSGVVGVRVEKSEFKKATLDVAGEVDIAIEGADVLRLEGSMTGKIGEAGLDLDGELKLRKKYRFSDGQVSAVLGSGDVDLKVKKSALSSLQFKNLVYRTRIVVEGSGMEGKYDDGKFHLGSEELSGLGVKRLVVDPDDSYDDSQD